jgi:hypothetical protein
VTGCGCLDPLVWGHVCGLSGRPDDGNRWSGGWRELPGLRDPSPRPVPYTEPTDGRTFRFRQLRQYLRVRP